MIRSAISRLWVMVALCLPASLLGGQASAQTITNIASATWQQAGQTMSAQSNPVAFTLDGAAAITTYTISPGAANTLSFTASQCGGSPVPVPGLIGGLISTGVTPSTTVEVGSPLYFSVRVPQANAHPNAIDSLAVTLTTSNGDKENLVIYETGPNTGVFAGAVPTYGVPPPLAQGDCKLSANAGDTINISAFLPGQTTPVVSSTVSLITDPFGYVFDSGTGASVSGAHVTLINTATGAPAQVFAPDGHSAWPSTVTTGQTITDGSGNSFTLEAGEYRFPDVAPGQYRLLIQPPAPYTAPSAASAAQLAGVLRPDGTPVALSSGSYGADFVVTISQPLRIDIPLDKPETPLAISKSASRGTAQPGDIVFYTLNVGNADTVRQKRDVVVADRPARQLRLQPKSVRIDGTADPGAVGFARDGSAMTVFLGSMAPASHHTITYAATVRPDATPGEALNTATASDVLGTTGTASAVVRILADTLTDRMTIIGRVTDGGCLANGPRYGIPGVRVMLEDGSFAVTDRDGRYHFDGVVPGDHVAQVGAETLPQGGLFVNCGRSTRNAGSAISRFVSGQGGSLAVADFYAELPPKPALPPGAKPVSAPSPDDAGPDAPGNKAAAGGDTDWLAAGDGPVDFLFPTVNHNPRSPAIRVVIRHHASQTVDLSANGQPVSKVAFDGMKTAPSHKYAISIWTGVPLDGEKTVLTAVVKNLDGSVATTLTRTVYFTNAAAQVQLMPALTRLVADGRTRPVIALKVTDRDGHPVHAGVSGDLGINAPYESADAIEGMQARALVGVGQQNPHWVVKGDDGIAYVALAPTMVSGAVHLDLNFDDHGQKRHQTIDSWMVPGDLPWTLVGLAEGSIGSKTIADAMQRTSSFDSDLGTHARTAFYAKGRVLGSVLLTVAYDSAKQAADQPLGGAINPRAYYTIFADGSARRFDAASRNKLYVRIEAKGFYALFGDFQTGFAATQLARYSRALTGVTGEAVIGKLHLQGFAAKTATSHRHLEIQGGGVSGPYSLGTSALVANSETITLEVRDRFRSNEIVSTTQLTRFIDYDVDMLSGTISFKSPVLSHDASLNPQFIIVDYDVDPTLAAGDTWVGGGRADVTLANGHLRLGATGISESNNGARTTLGAVDAKATIDAHTEVRAEAALSRTAGVTSNAWLVEAERHDKSLDLLAYARSADQAFGVGETSGAELGWRKIGLDTKLRITDRFSLITSVWDDHSLTDGADRKALQAKAEYRAGKADYHLGVSALNDHVPGTGMAAAPGVAVAGNAAGTSTIIDAGLTRRFFNDRLEIDADASVAVGSANSIDAPATDTLTARYALTNSVKLIGSYEIAHAGTFVTHTARAGFEVSPWQGAKMTASLGNQTIAEYGPRSFAAFGLAQSFSLTRHLTVDATVDANKVLHGFDITKIVNPAQPVVNGGQLDGSGVLTENFTAVTLGLGWKKDLWSATMRGEYRAGEFANRRGLTLGAIRQLGDGSVVGSGLTMTRASGSDGSRSAVLDAALAFAERPADSDVAMLGKLEFRSDYAVAPTIVANSAVGLNGSNISAATVSGVAGTANDSALTLTGNARSRRLVASLSTNWSPKGVDRNGDLTQRSEFALFLGARYNFDQYDGFNLSGTTLLAGLDAHVGIGESVEVGGSFTLRTNLSDHTSSYAYGPSIGVVPAKNVLLSIGYNFAGFRDPDFGAARSVNRGVFATLKVKFDTTTFGFLGLDGRAR